MRGPPVQDVDIAKDAEEAVRDAHLLAVHIGAVPVQVLHDQVCVPLLGVPEHVPNVQLDDIRVELTLKDAVEMFRRKGPDVVELYSQPRLCQEVHGRKFSGTELTPGYSLDLTMDDPATGHPWESKEATENI